jgi:hypothetical protein
MPGPAPDKNARRRNVRPDWVTLPGAGRSGPPPAWPLASKLPPAWAQPIWAQLWAKPQAVEWERLGMERVVARYVIILREAEKPGAFASTAGEARQIEDRLGLSPMALKRLQWEIAPVAKSETSGNAAVTSLDAYRDL